MSSSLDYTWPCMLFHVRRRVTSSRIRPYSEPGNEAEWTIVSFPDCPANWLAYKTLYSYSIEMLARADS